MPIVCVCVCACGHPGRSPLGLGSSGLDKGFANQGLTTSSSIGSRDTAYSLIGSCKGNRNFAVEGIYFDLGRKGKTVRSIHDCCIAQLALESRMHLVHNDNDFEVIEMVRRIKLHRFDSQAKG